MPTPRKPKTDPKNDRGTTGEVLTCRALVARGFDVEAGNSDAVCVGADCYRADLERQRDLVERGLPLPAWLEKLIAAHPSGVEL